MALTLPSPPPVFCDWLKLKMPASLVSAPFERYIECNNAYENEWKRAAWVDVRDAPQQCDYKRSDSTKIRVRWLADDGLLTIEGNLGRFGRRDNVWGSSVVAAAWNVLDFFAKTHKLRLNSPPEVRRVDLTANIAFRDARDASAYIAWTQGVKLGRATPTPYPTGTTWVTENWSGKVYDKIADLIRHGMTELAERIRSEVGYLLRLELTLRTDELARHGLDKLPNWQERMDAMTVLFTDKFAGLSRGGVIVDDAIRDMPNRLSNAVEAWRNGRDFPAAMRDGTMSRRTYYRMRKELLVYGIDISQRCNVTRMKIKPLEVPFRYVEAPDWYNEIQRDHANKANQLVRFAA